MRRRPTSADVATEAGVSRTTVSFVMNGRTDVKIPDETRRRVLSAAKRLDYYPHASARQLAGGRSRVIAMVLRQSPEQIASDAVLAETLRGVATAARADGFRVLVEPMAHEGADPDYADLVRARHADGMIVSGPVIDDPFLAEVAAEGFPIVLQGALAGLDVPSVDVDNTAAARGAVDHLISLGYRRIACISNAPLVYTSAQERVRGYRDALEAAGIGYRESLVATAGFDAPSGRSAMARLLGSEAFDAVFVASDVVALGAIAALRSAGRRVPDDVSIVGFDDIPLAAYFDPPLTTVRLPAFELGRAAGQALLDGIAGRTVPVRTLLATELVERASTIPSSPERSAIREVPGAVM